jgi:hypothetical protein
LDTSRQTKNLNKLLIRILLHLQVEFSKFFIDLSGEFGLTKIADGDGAPKNMNFSIGVGYKF